MAKKTKTLPGTIATNRKARHEFDLGESYECGIVLVGSEVKSLRESKVRLGESFARIINNELWLIGLHIGPYSHASAAFAHKTDRDRKLLARRDEIERMRRVVDNDGRTLVPTRLYFKTGLAKIEIATARRRRSHDKRQAIRERDAEMEARKQMGRY